jgi:hypothetical protein
MTPPGSRSEGQGTSMPLGQLAAGDGGPQLYLNFSQDSAPGTELRLMPQTAIPAGLYALVPVAGAPPVVEVAPAPASGQAVEAAPGDGGAAPPAGQVLRREASRR